MPTAPDFQSEFKGFATDETYLKDFAGIIKSEIAKDDVNSMFTIENDIATGDPVAVVGTIDKVLRTAQNCGDNADTKTFGGVQQKWNPKDLEVYLEVCWKDFEGSFIEFSRGYNNDKADLTQDVTGDFLEWYWTDALVRDIQRVALMGNGSAALDGSGGYFKTGVDIADYNLIDRGLVPTLNYLYTQTEFQGNFIEIPQNHISGKQTQYDGLDGTKKVSDLIWDMDEMAVNFDPNHLVMNYRMYQGYKRELKDAGAFPTDGTREIIKNGLQNIPVNGYNPVTSKIYDQYSVGDTVAQFGGHNDALDSYDRNFAVLTTKDNLRLGFDKESGITNTKFWLDDNTNKVKFRAALKMDFMVANPYHLLGAISPQS